MNEAAAQPDRPLKVAFFSPSWPPDRAANGIVPYVHEVAEGMRRLGHEPTILSGTGSGPIPGVYFLNQEARPLWTRLTDPIAFRMAPEQATRHRTARNLARAAERAVHERGVQLLEMEETFGYLELMRKRLKIPVVIRLHGPCFTNTEATGVDRNAEFRNRIRQEGVGISMADAISASSRAVLERTRSYYGLPLQEASVIHPPAPVIPAAERWRPQDCDTLRILFLGRFDRHKGGDVVIDCLRMLAPKFPGLRLWFAGKEKKLQDESGREWTLAEYLDRQPPEVAGMVDRLGFVSDAEVAGLRRKAFLTIVASRFEVLSLASLEAMAFGCPLVATRAGGIAEIVQDGVTGMLCEPGDAHDLASRVAVLLENPELAAKLGHRAAEVAATSFHPDAIARQIAELHRRQIHHWPNSGRLAAR